jgi:predicted Rossmann fold flavoprotein
MRMKPNDVLILGAGASGLMCASEAAARGRKVLVLDHAAKPGRKILASGGGRCNFTNLHAKASHYVTSNPDFVRSAISRFTSKDFIALVQANQIPFHEKIDGQMFCDRSAGDILKLLLTRAQEGAAQIMNEVKVKDVAFADGVFKVVTGAVAFSAPRLVVATGGLSWPKLGASDLGLKIARQFGLKVIEPSPALVGLAFDDKEKKRFEGLAGIHLRVGLSCGEWKSMDDLMIRHGGLSGPVILNASLAWEPGREIIINWVPEENIEATFRQLKLDKVAGGRGKVRTGLEKRIPRRLADRIAWHAQARGAWRELSDERLLALAKAIHADRIVPSGTFGWGEAEVMRGGVDTKELSSKTMESRKVPGLYFTGEVMDVTGQVGGYNLQWAWSSGWAAGQAV